MPGAMARTHTAMLRDDPRRSTVHGGSLPRQRARGTRFAPDGDGMRPLSTTSPGRSLLAAAGVVLATAARLAVDSLLGDRLPFLPFFVAIVLVAWYGGPGPSVLAVG